MPANELARLAWAMLKFACCLDAFEIFTVALLTVSRYMPDFYIAESKGKGQKSTTQKLEGLERTPAASQAEAEEAS